MHRQSSSSSSSFSIILCRANSDPRLFFKTPPLAPAPPHYRSLCPCSPILSTTFWGPGSSHVHVHIRHYINLNWNGNAELFSEVHVCRTSCTMLTQHCSASIWVRVKEYVCVHGIVTFRYEYINAGWFRIARRTCVISRVLNLWFTDNKTALCPKTGYCIDTDVSAWIIVVYHSIVLLPIDILRRCRALQYPRKEEERERDRESKSDISGCTSITIHDLVIYTYAYGQIDMCMETFSWLLI